MQPESYRKKFAISQSSIKDFVLKSPKKWKAIWIDGEEDPDQNQDIFTHGSLIDTLLFSPETLNDKYYISDCELPGKAICSIVTSVYNDIINKNWERGLIDDSIYPEPITFLEVSLETNPEIILHYCEQYKEKEEDKAGWNNHYKAQTKIDSIIKSGQRYFDLLKEANGRKVISLSMNLEAIGQKEVVLTDPLTRPYFIADEGIELIFQDEIFAEYQTKNGIIPIKGALDILRIDHNEKTIQECDFKTQYSAFGFLLNIKKLGYARQHSFYEHLIIIKYQHLLEEGYKMLNPINIVIDKSRIPYIYEFNSNDLFFERDGNKGFLYNLYNGQMHNQRIKKGWFETLEEIAWHINKNAWDKPMELYETGKIMVNLLNS